MFEHMLWQINRERRHTLLKVGETQRCLRALKVKTPTRKDRLLVRLGNFFIALGLRLKMHYELTLHQSSTPPTQ
jgi:hypothetical protein